MKLLQIRGTVSATKRIDDAMGNEIGAQLETPETWNAEKFKSTADATGSCAEPQGYEWWSTPARTDEKVRVYGAFWVPEDSEVLGIAHSKIDSTAAEEGVADAPAPEPAPAVAPAPAPAPAPVQPEADPVIGFTEAPGVAQPTAMNKTISHCGDPGLHETGTTFFTDGTSGWTQTCASQMM